MNAVIWVELRSKVDCEYPSDFRACLKNHSRNLHAPLCGIFCRKPFSNTLWLNTGNCMGLVEKIEKLSLYTKMEVKFEAFERNIWKKLMKTPAIFCIIYA